MVGFGNIFGTHCYHYHVGADSEWVDVAWTHIYPNNPSIKQHFNHQHSNNNHVFKKSN